MAIDLHTHTEASFDSSFSLADRVALAKDAGLTAVACTDHAAVNPDLDRPTEMIDGIEVIAGVELFTRGEFGRMDILGLMIDPDWLRPRLGDHDDRLPYDEAIELIHDAGGVAVMAHPGRYDIDLEAAVKELIDHGLDGIETAYPYQFVSDPMPFTPREEIERLADEYELLATGGSDCHGNRRRHMGAVRLDESVLRAVRAAADQY